MKGEGLTDELANTDEAVLAEMRQNASYPDVDDPDIQHGLYVKREFYINRVPIRPAVPDSERLEAYRELCPPKSGATPSQSFLPKFIHPSTPYTGALVAHGTGAGKTRIGIYIGENFKGMVDKYGTKIHVLVPGPLIRENFISELLASTGDTYSNGPPPESTLSDTRAYDEWYRGVLSNIYRYYHIYTHRGFSKRVLGDKIIDTKLDSEMKSRKVARRNKEGNYERELSVDHIENLDNGLLIIDEAHNITDNDYGLAVEKIISQSKNLKIVLLTATPNKNYADGVIQLVNMLRPRDSQMQREKIFTPQGYDMAFREGGEEYFRQHIRGYISYVRGNDPLTFATRKDMGVIPPQLSFTKVTLCPMEDFQAQAYRRVTESASDSFDRESEAVSNFAMPGLNRGYTSVVSWHGIEGLNTVAKQISNYGDTLRKLLAEGVMSDCPLPKEELIYLNDKKEISGAIFRRPYLSRFSAKFDRALRDMEEYVEGKKGARTMFVYSNLVRSGIELFARVMDANGYLEYREDSSEYNITPETRCYYCGEKRADHKGVTDHTFGPSVYTLITGGGEDEGAPDEKFNSIRNVFNKSDNRDGHRIKFVLGSRVMKEGVSLRNISSIYILDVHYTLGRVEQVLGRGIRFCMHSDLMSEDNLYPMVEAYRYVIDAGGGQSTEIEMYAKAEAKFKLISVVDRICAEEAVDCPLMRGVNIFREEVEKYRGCGSAEKPCPAVCGYQNCEYQCASRKLINDFYDPQSGMFRKLSQEELDYSTYTREMAKSEIEVAKNIIIGLYRREYVYTLRDLLRLVKESLSEDAAELFDPFYVYQALDDMIPVTANDFNNWSIRLRDKYGRPGYLIYVEQYYLFQPFGSDTDLPAYYRSHYTPDLPNQISLRDYLTNRGLWKEGETVAKESSTQRKKLYTYDYSPVMDYYQSKPEGAYVGILDSPTVGSLEEASGEQDQFKIRGKRPRYVKKKRQAGVPSFFGSVCNTSKSMVELGKMARKLGLSDYRDLQRGDLCSAIRDRLYAMERYGDGKKTWLIIPANHPTLPFPLNLHDRVAQLTREAKAAGLTVSGKKEKKSKGEYSDLPQRTVTVSLKGKPPPEMVEKYSFSGKGQQWQVVLD